MAASNDLIYAIVEADHPTSDRHTFYRVVSEGAMPKTEQSYRKVCRQVLQLRRAGIIPYAWITDNTRWIRHPSTYSTLYEMLVQARYTYRRSLWDTNEVRVEVWCESNSVAGTLGEVTDRWDVPLIVLVGYGSDSYLYSIAEGIKAYERPTHIYYFGDHDPSGKDIPRVALKGVRTLAPDVDAQLTWVAVTPEQIATMQLLTKPANANDPRAATFAGETVEIEAIPTTALRRLVEQCLLAHIDMDYVAAQEQAQAREREFLEWCLDHLAGEGAWWMSKESPADRDQAP
jgi:hypothetical protein